MTKRNPFGLPFEDDHFIIKELVEEFKIQMTKRNPFGLPFEDDHFIIKELVEELKVDLGFRRKHEEEVHNIVCTNQKRK